MLLCLLGVAAAAQDNVLEGSVSEHDGIYRLHVEADVNAAPAVVYAVIADHARLERVSPVITGSTLLDAPGPGHVRRRLMLHTCILLFCFTGPLVEDVAEQAPRGMQTIVVPALSDFRSGGGGWQVNALPGGHSHLRINYTLQPDFWIPPVVGPWLIRHKMLHEAKEALRRIQAFAQTP